MDQTEGIVWEQYVDYPIVRGVEQKNNQLFVADNNGSIYSLWMDTGTLVWKINPGSGSEGLIALCPDDSSLVAASILGSSTRIRRHSYLDGSISFVTNILSFSAKDSYLADSGNLVLHSDKKIAVYNLSNDTCQVIDYTVYGANNIAAVVKGGFNYYLVETNSTIQVLDSSFGWIRTLPFSSSADFYGSADFYSSTSSYLYLATETGIRQMQVPFGPAIFSGDGRKIYYSGLVLDSGYLYTAFADSTKGIAKYDTSLSLMRSGTLSAKVSYSPIAYSSSTSTVSAVDDSGILNIFDKNTMNMVYNKYIGFLGEPYLKIGQDSSGSIFIPLTSPAKITCYSLNYAISQRR
jgi:hypothetical protein